MRNVLGVALDIQDDVEPPGLPDRGPTGPTGPTGPLGPTGPTGAGFGAWVAYSPTWTTTGSAPVLGNGILNGKSVVYGTVRHVLLQLVWGSTTTGGTGRWVFSLPAAFADLCLFHAILVHGADVFLGTAVPLSSATFEVVVDGAPGGITATTPFVFGNGDQIQIAGSYEV